MLYGHRMKLCEASHLGCDPKTRVLGYLRRAHAPRTRPTHQSPHSLCHHLPHASTWIPRLASSHAKRQGCNLIMDSAMLIVRKKWKKRFPHLVRYATSCSRAHDPWPYIVVRNVGSSLPWCPHHSPPSTRPMQVATWSQHVVPTLPTLPTLRTLPTLPTPPTPPTCSCSSVPWPHLTEVRQHNQRPLPRGSELVLSQLSTTPTKTLTETLFLK